MHKVSRFISSLALSALLLNLFVVPAQADEGSEETLLPDLVVSSASYESDTFNFVVSNTGAGNVDETLFPDLNFIFDFTSSELPDPTSVSIPIDEAGGSAYRTAGGSTTISLPVDDEAPGCTMYFLLVADGNGEVTESDDSNNEYRGSFNLCSGLGIDLYTESTTPMHDMIIDFELGNQGSISVPHSFADEDLGTNYFYVDGVYVRQARWSWHVAGFDLYSVAGGSQTRYLPLYYVSTLTTLGSHTATHCIDATNVVEELDEENNCATTTFELTELPDLFATVNSVDTDTGTLNFTLGNNSNVNVLNWFGNYEISMNGTVLQAQDWITDSESSYVNALTSSARTYVFDTSILMEGSNTAQVCMDQEANITESDETNNCAALTFTVSSEGGDTGGGDTDSGGSPTDPSTPTDTSTPTVVIVGGSGAGNFSQSHQDDNDSEGSSDSDVVLSEDTGTECAPMPFVDVDSSTVGYEAILGLWCAGVVQGRDATHFMPDDSIKRDEVTKIVARLYGYVTAPSNELPVLTETSYTDVPVTEVLAYYIETLTGQTFFETEKALGIFRPHDYMTSTEIAELLSQATGETVTVEMVADYKGGDTMSRGGFAALAMDLF
jgi:hypothetical protein